MSVLDKTACQWKTLKCLHGVVPGARRLTVPLGLYCESIICSRGTKLRARLQKEGEGGKFWVKSGSLVVDGAVAPRYHSSTPSFFVAFQLSSGTVRNPVTYFTQSFKTSQDTDDLERV